jgi:hypothetical protein
LKRVERTRSIGRIEILLRARKKKWSLQSSGSSEMKNLLLLNSKKEKKRDREELN